MNLFGSRPVRTGADGPGAEFAQFAPDVVQDPDGRAAPIGTTGPGHVVAPIAWDVVVAPDDLMPGGLEPSGSRQAQLVQTAGVGAQRIRLTHAHS